MCQIVLSYMHVPALSYSDIHWGRHYGGVAIIWSLELNKCIHRVSVRHNRCIAVIISSSGSTTLLKNVYGPVDLQVRSIPDKLIELVDEADMLVESLPHNLILAGDWNCDIKRQSSRCETVRQF